MPQLVHHIDKIALRLGRDVLFADIPRELRKGVFGDEGFRYQNSKTRRAAIAFLDQKGIRWKRCMGMSVPGLILAPYLGAIFIDVRNDPSDANYRTVCDFFEDENENPRFSDYHLFLLPLTMAQQHAAR